MARRAKVEAVGISEPVTWPPADAEPGPLTLVRGLYPEINAAYSQTDRVAIETLRRSLGTLAEVVEAMLERGR